jgi:hypothetical protein
MTDNLKTAVTQLRPVMVTLAVHPDFDELSPANPVYDDVTGDIRGYHTVVIAGYDNLRNAFRILNSWGPGWGDAGYGWVAYGLTSYMQAAYILDDPKFVPPATDNSLYIQEGNHLWRTDNDFGDYIAISPAIWNGSKALASLDDTLYLVRESQLYEVSLEGLELPLGPADLDGEVALASAAGRLIVHQHAELASVDVLTGERTPIGMSYPNTTAMAGDSDTLYLVDEGILYRVDADDGDRVPLGKRKWLDVTSMTAFEGSVYLVSEKQLWKVAVSEAAEAERVSDDEWYSSRAMTNLNGRLYLISGGFLYELDLRQGSKVQLGGLSWSLSPLLTAIP